MSERPILYGLFVVILAVLATPLFAAENDATAAPAPALRAGFARADITPEAGAQIPGGFNKNISTGTLDPLWAEAAYLENGGTRVAIVGLDTLMIPDSTIAEARRLTEEKTGVPAGNILIGASHTHSGGPVVDCFGSDEDPAYSTLIATRVAEAIAEAQARAVPALLGSGSGYEDRLGFNRRFYMKDGTVRTHPGKMNPDIVEPAGPIDPEVGVLAFQDTAGKPLGCIVNFALHGTTMGGSRFSADYVGYLRATVRGALAPDMGVVFLNGACGDVTQVDNRSPRPSEFGEVWAGRTGRTLGAEVLKIIAWMDFQAEAPLAVQRADIRLAIRDLAESDEALLAREAPETGLGSGGGEVYLREAGLVREMKAKSPDVPAEVQVIRVGDTAIASNPTEYFCALGLSIKKGSPWKRTFVVELANGYAGYSPTEKAFSEGGYEIRTARSSFIAPGCGEQIAKVAIDLLNTLNNSGT